MSEENMEVVRRSFDAYNRDGLDALLPHLHPEVEWTTSGAFLEAATYRGRKEVRRYLGSMLDEFEAVRNQPEELIARWRAGDRLGAGQWAGQTERRRRRDDADGGLLAAGRHDRPHPQLAGQVRSPRSGRASGVGDAAGDQM
jgi:ketosteroid isomerase-like protein